LWFEAPFEGATLKASTELAFLHVELGKQQSLSKQSGWERLNVLVDKGFAYKKDGVVYAKT
jgi:hypothetical protein